MQQLMMDTSPTPGEGEQTPEQRDAATAAAFDKAQADAATQAQQTPPAPAEAPATKPDGLPDKFWNAETGEVRTEDLIKSYTELEKTTSRPKDGEGGQEADAKGGDETDAERAAKAKGVDVEAYQTEFLEAGALSEASYAELAEKGFDKDLVDSYIDGQHALADQMRAEALSAFGKETSEANEKAFDEFSQWAVNGGITPEQIESLNEAMAGEPSTARLALEGAITRMRSGGNGDEPSLQGDTVPGEGAGDVYESWAQVRADMASDLYKTDPAEQSRVAAKLERSSI